MDACDLDGWTGWKSQRGWFLKASEVRSFECLDFVTCGHLLARKASKVTRRWKRYNVLSKIVKSYGADITKTHNSRFKRVAKYEAESALCSNSHWCFGYVRQVCWQWQHEIYDCGQWPWPRDKAEARETRSRLWPRPQTLRPWPRSSTIGLWTKVYHPWIWSHRLTLTVLCSYSTLYYSQIINIFIYLFDLSLLAIV